MGFSFSSKKTENIIAILDIASGSVGGALVQLPVNSTGIPTIISSTRTEIIFQDVLDFNVFLEDMLVALDQTVKLLNKGNTFHPSEVVCVLASPWYLSETRVIKYSEEKPFIFTKRLANELFEKEIKSITEMYKIKYGGSNSEPEVIEQHTMSVSLNGYTVQNPINIRTKSIDMHMILSVSPKIALEKIRKTLSNSFHTNKVSFMSFSVASYIAVRDRYISPDSYLLLDISGEITDVGIVLKGILKATLSFPFGKKTIFKYMCTKLEIELRDAEELFNLHNSGIISEKYKSKLLPLFTSIENSWSESFRQCIQTLPHTIILPGTIFLTADTDIRSWFAKVIQNDIFIASMVTERTCNVVTLEGPEFLDMCAVKGGSCDPFLMLESIAVMRKKNP